MSAAFDLSKEKCLGCAEPMTWNHAGKVYVTTDAEGRLRVALCYCRTCWLIERCKAG